MNLNFKGLRGIPVRARDGNIGKLKDILYDDESWEILHFVVETGNWLTSRRVLLDPESVFCCRSKSTKVLSASLSIEEIESSPLLSSKITLLGQCESRMLTYYGWPSYFDASVRSGFPYQETSYSNIFHPADSQSEDWNDFGNDPKNNVNGNLRSLYELIGYKVNSLDAVEFGDISDVLLDSKNWLLIDLIINANRWLPGGKRFVCSPKFASKIDQIAKLIDIDLTETTLIESPDYNPQTYGKLYRESLVEHYRSGQQIEPPSAEVAPLPENVVKLLIE